VSPRNKPNVRQIDPNVGADCEHRSRGFFDEQWALVVAASDPLLPFLCDESAGRCYDICTVQEHLGHSDVKATIIYAHVLRMAARLAYIGRSMGHEDFRGGSYEYPIKTLW